MRSNSKFLSHKWVARTIQAIALALFFFLVSGFSGESGALSLFDSCPNIKVACYRQSVWHIKGFVNARYCTTNDTYCGLCSETVTLIERCNFMFKDCKGQCFIRLSDDKCYDAKGVIDCLGQ